MWSMSIKSKIQFIVLIGSATLSLQAQSESQKTDLGTLMAIATTEHPMVRSKLAEVEAANSERKGALWQYWPTPSINLQRPDKALTPGTDRNVQILNLRQPLWSGGRLDAQVTQAEARIRMATARSQEARREVALELLQAFGDAYVAHSKIQATTASLDVHQDLMHKIQRRTSEGLSAASDTQLADSRLQGVKADLSQTRNSFDISFNKLTSLVNRPIIDRSLIFPRFKSKNDGVIDFDKAFSLDPALQRLNAEVAEIEAQIQINQSSLWPEIYANVTSRRGDVTGHTSQVLIGIESKLGAGLSNLSAIDSAKKKLIGKYEEIENRKRRLSEQISADQKLIASLHERARAYTQALKSSQEVVLSWERQFLAGKKTSQDLMNAAKESTQTEIQMLESLVSAAVVEWRLAILLHGLEPVMDQAKSRLN
jgi:outer membrane protein, adhesin transport system